MARRVYVRDLNLLLDLDRSLGEFSSRAQDILDTVQREIQANKEWLAERRRYWSREVERCRWAYELCRRQQDEEDRGSGCGAEAAALRRAEEALEVTRRWSVRIEQAAGEYAPYAERIRQLTGSRVNRARTHMAQSIEKYRDDIGRRAFGLPASGLPDGYPAPQAVGKSLPYGHLYADHVYSFSREKNPEIYEKYPENAERYAQLAEEYPEGVRFDAYGFPDFLPYAVDSCMIEMTGDREEDEKRANEETRRQETPGYTWHHCQDARTMLLVPRLLHESVPHTGGAAIVKAKQKPPETHTQYY